MKDWKIRQSRWDPRCKILVHLCSTTSDGWICTKRVDGRWKCPLCKTSAPEEIEFCAELGNCITFDDAFIKNRRESL